MIVALSAGVVLTAGITAFICLKIPARNKASKTVESAKTVENAAEDKVQESPARPSMPIWRCRAIVRRDSKTREFFYVK